MPSRREAVDDAPRDDEMRAAVVVAQPEVVSRVDERRGQRGDRRRNADERGPAACGGVACAPVSLGPVGYNHVSAFYGGRPSLRVQARLSMD
jgi:hypothetical protein